MSNICSAMFVASDAGPDQVMAPWSRNSARSRTSSAWWTCYSTINNAVPDCLIVSRMA